MISQVVANPKSTTTNEYGFYAIPKTIKPKSKYRQTDNEDDTYSKKDEDQLVPLQGHQQDEVERDFFVDEAPYPEFMPKEPGIDQQVQVEDEELFDFDRQVEPLLQILVGQSVLKSRNELQQQNEQKESKAKLKQFQKKRQAELMVTQRLQAHNRRRKQENERRQLQHDVYTKQKKLVLRKLHAFNQSKRALVNLKSEVLNDLQTEGLLRHNIFVRMRSEFVPWLYDQINNSLEISASMTSAGEHIFSEKQDELMKKHKQNIEKQAKRRKDILDQRQRDRLAEQQRKRKKAIRKQRLALNKARTQKEEKIYDAIGKGQKVQKITKTQISDNRVKSKPVVYISGGTLGYLAQAIALLSQAQIIISSEKLQSLLIKMLKQFQFPIELSLPPTLKQILETIENDGKVDPKAFNQKLQQTVQQLVENQTIISEIYSQFLTHNQRSMKQIIKVLLRIYLTQPLPVVEKLKPLEELNQQGQQPPLVEEPKSELTQAEKIRLAVRGNLQLNFEKFSENKPTDIIRIRYSRKGEESELAQQQKQQEYIQIFDGQGWNRFIIKNPQLKPLDVYVGFNLTGFESSLVHDQISNNYFANYLYGLFTSQGLAVDKVKFIEMAKELSQNHSQKLRQKHGGKDVPIYDVQYDY